MSDPPTLDQLVTCSPRFARSVSLARDAYQTEALAGYILTPTGRDVLRRLADALRGESPARAWSLTGPYGSGKSAFALAVAQILAGQPWVRQEARKFLAAADPELSERFFGTGSILPKKAGRLCPVLVTGSREPLEKALAARLAAALRTVATLGRPPAIIERLDRLANDSAPTGTAIVGLFEEANAYLERYGNEAAGILLIIDELGKFLEYGASNPDRGDVFVLQELAEAATRSKRPFLFLTILHQALDRYADHMSPERRSEWAKVQGRFEDIAFEERAEQLLRLVTDAIQLHGDGPRGWRVKPLLSAYAPGRCRSPSFRHASRTATPCTRDTITRVYNEQREVDYRSCGPGATCLRLRTQRRVVPDVEALRGGSVFH